MSKTQTRVPYQVYVDRKVRVRAVRKARENGMTLNSFMAMAMQEFIDLPVAESQRRLRKFNRGKEKI